MTEVEWLAATEPTPMLEFIRNKASDRKLRLFACACCRSVGPQIGIDFKAVRVAEDYADGRVKQSTLSNARRAAPAAWVEGPNTDPVAEAIGCAVACALTHVRINTHPVRPGTTAGHDRQQAEQHTQAQVVRDILGNPFRPIPVDPSWLSSTAIALAKAIYADRAFDRLLILADALQDAGCENPVILNHLRSDGPHVRGCWALDLILGKE
jgi:hypothetical protein